MHRRVTPRPEPVPDVDPALCADAAGTFAILASTARIRLLWLLARGEYDVGTLAERAGLGVTGASQHLAKLRLAGLVSVRVEGKRHVYVVDDPHVVSLVEQALDHHADLRARAAAGTGGAPAGDGGGPAAAVDLRGQASVPSSAPEVAGGTS